jgi:hypothetical protein
MNKPPEILTFDIKHLTAELRRIEDRLKSEPAPDPVALNDFRHAVDNVRLAAWSVGELLNAKHIKKSPNTVMAFLSAERVRKFNLLVQNLCGDIERGVITLETTGMPTLCESVIRLQAKLTRTAPITNA